MASYAPIGQAGFSSTPFNYSPLLSDGDDVVSRSASMASGGGVQKRGTILKYDPATGLITIPAATTDCNAILVNDIDATSAAASALIYVGGKFKADAIIWPGALSHALCTESLRMHDIQIESVVFTDGTLVKAQSLDSEGQAAQQVVEFNKSEEEAARSGAPGKAAAEQKPSMDSPWAYLTAEEREKNPEFAEVPTAKELGEAVGAGEGSGTPVTLSPTSDTVAATPETASFHVTMTAPGMGTWTPVKDSSTWLSIVSPTAPQSTDGDVTYAVGLNNSGLSRTATITVNGKTFTINQSAT
jgi:hypothetical protein